MPISSDRTESLAIVTAGEVPETLSADLQIKDASDLLTEITRFTAINTELYEALDRLLRHVDRETCTHEDRYRGGMIWEICRACGAKWADDDGGFKPHVDRAEVKTARALLKARGDK